MYKDKEQAKEASKERMRKYREGVTKGVTSLEGCNKTPTPKGVTKEEGVTKGVTKGVTGKGVTSGVTEMMPAVGILPERTRYLKLSDGQVLDRKHLPVATKSLGKLRDARVIDPVRAESYRLRKEGTVSANPVLEALAYPSERAKLRRVCTELSTHHQLSNVSYGAYGTPMEVVAEYLEAF